MSFTPEEIQDLEDAIYFTAELMALRQEEYSPAERARTSRFVIRLLALRTKLSEPVKVTGNN